MTAIHGTRQPERGVVPYRAGSGEDEDRLEIHHRRQGVTLGGVLLGFPFVAGVLFALAAALAIGWVLVKGLIR